MSLTPRDTRIEAFTVKGASSEQSFIAEAEATFRVEARRNHLLADWASGLMGMDAAEAADYVMELITADLTRPGSDDILEKLAADFAARGVAMPEETLRRKVADLEMEARRQLDAAG